MILIRKTVKRLFVLTTMKNRRSESSGEPNGSFDNQNFSRFKNHLVLCVLPPAERTPRAEACACWLLRFHLYRRRAFLWIGLLSIRPFCGRRKGMYPVAQLQ